MQTFNYWGMKGRHTDTTVLNPGISLLLRVARFYFSLTNLVISMKFN